MDRSTLAVAALAVLLVGTATGTTVLVGAERTVLDAGYVTGTIAEEDRYDEARAPFVATVRDRLTEEGDPVPDETPPGIEVRQFDREALAESAVADAFGPARIDDTIEGIYGYLHGRQGAEVLTLSLEDVKAAYATRITDEAIRIDVAALADIAETDGPLDINRTTVEGLVANESSYEATRAAHRASLPEGTDVEALGERTKADLEPAIENATADYDPAVTQAVIALQFATVDALTTDLTYDTYRSRIDDAEANLRAVAGDRVRERIDGLAPDSIALGGADGPLPNLDNTAGTVQTLDLLVWVFPIVALGIIGLLYGVTRSAWRTVRATGGALLVAAVIPLVPAILGRNAIASGTDGALAADGGDFGAVVAPIVEGFLAVLVGQSLLLAAVGIALLGVVWADRRGRLDGVRDALGVDPAPLAGDIPADEESGLGTDAPADEESGSGEVTEAKGDDEGSGVRPGESSDGSE